MFIRVDLVKQFQPRADNKVYGLDRLVDVTVYPQARSLTFILVADALVNAAVTMNVVGNDNPDPGGGINLGEGLVTTALKSSRLATSLSIAAAPFPFYGVTVTTGATSPSAGFISVYVFVWWGE